MLIPIRLEMIDKISIKIKISARLYHLLGNLTMKRNEMSIELKIALMSTER